MRRSLNRVYIHCVWATWDRLPLITPHLQQQIYTSILNKCQEMNCEVLAIGGVEDHVHLVIQLAATVSLATLVREVKGSSSHLAARIGTPEAFFKWQGSYSVFSVSPEILPRVITYVGNQKEHHRLQTLQSEWESNSQDDE